MTIVRLYTLVRKNNKPQLTKMTTQKNELPDVTMSEFDGVRCLHLELSLIHI